MLPEVEGAGWHQRVSTSTGTHSEANPKMQHYCWFSRKPVLSWCRHESESLRDLTTWESEAGAHYGTCMKKSEIHGHHTGHCMKSFSQDIKHWVTHKEVTKGLSNGPLSSILTELKGHSSYSAVIFIECFCCSVCSLKQIVCWKYSVSWVHQLLHHYGLLRSSISKVNL